MAWVKGTTLTGYQRRMPPALFRRFLKTYRERLFEALADERPFLFPIKRILIWGRGACLRQPANRPGAPGGGGSLRTGRPSGPRQ